MWAAARRAAGYFALCLFRELEVKFMLLPETTVLAKFKNVLKAFKNANSYQELLDARQRLSEVREQISAEERELAELGTAKQALVTEIAELSKTKRLAPLTEAEVAALLEAKAADAFAGYCAWFENAFKKSLADGNSYFHQSWSDVSDAERQGMEMLAKKLKSEGMDAWVTKPEFESTGAAASWVTTLCVETRPKPGLLKRIFG